MLVLKVPLSIFLVLAFIAFAFVSLFGSSSFATARRAKNVSYFVSSSRQSFSRFFEPLPSFASRSNRSFCLFAASSI